MKTFMIALNETRERSIGLGKRLNLRTNLSADEIYISSGIQNSLQIDVGQKVSINIDYLFEMLGFDENL